MSKIDLEFLEKKLEKCKNVDINDVNIDEIEDIENIKIDTKKSSVERILDFLNVCKNPYLFKVNDTIVQICFSNDSNISATESVSQALKNEFKK